MKRTRTQWWMLGAAVASAMALMVLVVGCARVDTRRRMATAPLALVLEVGRPSRIHVIDASTGRELRVIGLRSFTSDMDVHARSRRVVTAQAGGVGRDADRACGVVDLLRGGRTSYVDLKVPNPDSVGIVGDRAYFVHGFEQRGGLAASVVDVTEGTLLRSAHVDVGVGSVDGLGGRLYSDTRVIGEDGSARTALACLSTRSLETSIVARDALESFTLLPDLPGSRDASRALMVGWRGHDGAQRASSSQVWKVRLTDGRVDERVTVPGVRYGLEGACSAGTGLATLDADSTDPPGSPARVLFLGSRLTLNGSLELQGTPSAIASYRNRLLVADGAARTVSLIDPQSRRVVWRTKIRLARPVGLQIATIP